MKKAKRLAVILSLLLCLGLFAGCDMLAPRGSLGDAGDEVTDTSPYADILEKYGKLPEAASIGQKIEIAQGDFVQYESVKTYVKTQTGYDFTGTVKKLNPLPEGDEVYEGPYTETEVKGSVPAGTYSVKLDLNELYFTMLPTVKDGVMEAKVRNDSVKRVFGISASIPDAVSPYGTVLKIMTDDEHVTGITIAYESKNSTVTIVLQFQY